MKRLILLGGCFALIVFALACQQQQAPTDTRANDENTLRELDAQWSQAASAKDLDKTVSFYSDDALVLPANGAAISSKEGVRKTWQEMLMSPGFTGGWKATRVEVARSGDLGYVTGTFEFTMNDASGKPATDRGKFLEIWKKQGDGSWKCTVDIWNSDLPLPTTPTQAASPTPDNKMSPQSEMAPKSKMSPESKMSPAMSPKMSPE